MRALASLDRRTITEVALAVFLAVTSISDTVLQFVHPVLIVAEGHVKASGLADGLSVTMPVPARLADPTTMERGMAALPSAGFSLLVFTSAFLGVSALWCKRHGNVDAAVEDTETADADRKLRKWVGRLFAALYGAFFGVCFGTGFLYFDEDKYGHAVAFPFGVATVVGLVVFMMGQVMVSNTRREEAETKLEGVV